MSDKLIRKTIDELGLSGNLKIFYDFDAYSQNYILSTGFGDADYSGNIVNYQDSFTGQSSGSGFFDNQYITVSNSSQITSENATIIMSQKKTGISNGVLFSHLDPNGPSGWEIGINQANKYYFKNFIDGTPYYYTLDSYLSDQNVCGVTVSEFGSVNLFRLNYEKKVEKTATETFINDLSPESSITYYNSDQKKINIPEHAISNGSNWNIGSGEFAYKGYLDNFFYFDRVLNNDQLRKVVFSIYADYNDVPAVLGTAPGIITGYEITSGEVSGELGREFIETGVYQKSGFYTYESGVEKTGYAEISGFVYIPHTGLEELPGTNQVGKKIYKKVHNLSNVFEVDGSVTATGLSGFESIGSYWHFSGNSGTFNGNSSIAPENTIFGITGFDMVTQTGYLSGSSGVIFETGIVSGVKYYTFDKTPLYSQSKSYIISGATIEYTKNLNPEYYANGISLISEQNDDYFYEIIYDADESQKLNQVGVNSINGTYNKVTAKLSEIIDPHNLNLTINGVSQITGSIEYGKNEYNFPTFEVSTGFHIIKSQVFTKTELNINDLILYDYINSGDRSILEINSLNDYINIPFVNFDFEDADVFLNGVKQYSGIDYIDNAGFQPIGNALQVTGIYFTYPKYSGSHSHTGIGNEGIEILHDAINPNSYVTFFNGIRQPRNTMISHSRNSDLISGTIINGSNNLLYNMVNGLEQQT